MPRYEFLCEKCKKPFELIMTIAEREKAKPKCPDLQGHEGLSAVQRLHGADVEEELNAIFTRLKWNRAPAISSRAGGSLDESDPGLASRSALRAVAVKEAPHRA